MAATGTSAEVPPSAPTTVDRRGEGRGDVVVEHPLGLLGRHPHRGDVDGQLDRRGRVAAGGQRGGDRLRGALPVQRAAVGRRRPRAAWCPPARSWRRPARGRPASAIVSICASSAVSSPVMHRLDRAVAEERDQPRPRVQRLVVGGVHGAVDVERDAGRGAGTASPARRRRPRCGRRDARRELALQRVGRGGGGEAADVDAGDDGVRAGCHRRRRAGRRRRRRPGRASAAAGISTARRRHHGRAATGAAARRPAGGPPAAAVVGRRRGRRRRSPVAVVVRRRRRVDGSGALVVRGAGIELGRRTGARRSAVRRARAAASRGPPGGVSSSSTSVAGAPGPARPVAELRGTGRRRPGAPARGGRGRRRAYRAPSAVRAHAHGRRSARVGCCGIGVFLGSPSTGGPRERRSRRPPVRTGRGGDAAASSGEGVIAGATIAPRSGGDALLAVGVDDVDGDVTELALVLTGVVPAEDEVAPARRAPLAPWPEHRSGRSGRERRGHRWAGSSSASGSSGSSLALYRTDPRLRIGLLHSARMDPSCSRSDARVTTDSPKEMSP